MNRSAEKLGRLLADAHCVTVFSGAGLSTESGVPDFRSPGGVWSRMKPIYFQDFVVDEAMRVEAWGRVFSGAAGWTSARPNAGHAAVTALVNHGRAQAVITQNVDNLHQDSGTPGDRVIELHGNASYATCLSCGLRHELADLRGPFVERGIVPVCRACGALVKTATISFGQPMPDGPMAAARASSLSCDLFLVLGSSLVVYPAAGFPLLAKRRGARLVILNREATDQDLAADLVLHEEIGAVLPDAVAQALS